MDPVKSALAVVRDPNINVPRPVFKAPAMTQSTAWRSMSRMEKRAEYGEDEPRTQPTLWISKEQLRAPWWELYPDWKPPGHIGRPPLPADARVPIELVKVTIAQSEVQKKRLRSKEEEEDDKDDKQPTKKQKLGESKKAVPEPLKQTRGPPKRTPGIFPLSPQEARTPRPKNPDTDRLRAKYPGPGEFEYRWRNNERADVDSRVRNSIAAAGELPEVRNMPPRSSGGRRALRNFQYMGDQQFFSIPVRGDGNCFFGAVSIALYGTSKFWHLVKYEHWYFFRYVLTHPAHPRHDFYWALNSTLTPHNHNMWQSLSVPHAWQSGELFSVTADIYNLFIVLYEQLPKPEDKTRSQRQQDNQSIDIFGQYNATHVFFHLLDRNHYQFLRPRANPEAQFPFPDGTTIAPRPGRMKQRPFGGKGRPILPPPIAQPTIPPPNPLNLARVLGYNTPQGTLDLETMNRWIRIERREAEDQNDPTSLKWWLEDRADEGHAKMSSSV